VPALFLGSLIFLFPESPRWYIDHNHQEKGLQTLANLHAHGDKTNEYVLAEYNLILEQTEAEHLNPANGYTQLFSSRANIRRVIMTTMIQASCQLTGVEALGYFAPQIFAQIGINTSTTLLLAAVNAIITWLGTATEMCIVDRVGRRPLEIWGSVIMAATFIVGAVLLEQYSASNQNAGAHWGFIVNYWVFNYVFFVTSGPLSWALPVSGITKQSNI